jgi:DNA-binding transcriptional ArsR family regulator
MNTPQALAALAALSQDHRLGIFRLLVQHGPEELAAGTIAERMDMAGATLSFHLKELARAGLVNARHDGRFRYYSANYAAMNELMAYLTDNCCQGEACAVACVPNTRAQRKRA